MPPVVRSILPFVCGKIFFNFRFVFCMKQHSVRSDNKIVAISEVSHNYLLLLN